MTCLYLSSPNTNNTNNAYYLGACGGVYYSVCGLTFGSRPAFLLPSNYVVEPENALASYTTRELVEELFSRADK